MRIYIFLILFFKMSVANSPMPINEWIIWNSGQGQWITQITNETCTHFDFGGEVFTLKKIKPLYIQFCKNKTNELYLSHTDWDHYGFYNFLIQNNIKTCWRSKPFESLKKINFDVPFCTAFSNDNTKILFHDSSHILNSTNRNDTSTVITTDHFLIQGDSPFKQEKKWVKNISETDEIRFLILGHHGSRTSTSDFLLSRLPQLKMAFATSRFKKYGHPHKDVVERLKQHHLNAITTESWGTIQLIR